MLAPVLRLRSDLQVFQWKKINPIQEVKLSQENLPAVSQETGIDISAKNELQITPQAAMVIQEVQGAILVAKKFPRDMGMVWDKVTKACQRKTLAEKACYSFPRGGTTITGPSINLAQTIIGYYGNVRVGLDVIRDDDESRLIRAWVWDVENNFRVSLDDEFQKVIYRKKDGWIKPDERDLRELTNRRGAILLRNAIFKVIPRDLIEDAVAICNLTLKNNIKDPDSEKKRLVMEFQKQQITVKMLNAYLKHDSWDTWGADELVELSNIINTLREGVATKDEYFAMKADPATGEIKMADLSAGDPATHQGHEPAKKGRVKKAESSAENPTGPPAQVEVPTDTETLTLEEREALPDQKF